MESLEFHIPRFNELPRVPLYKDQVITYLENLGEQIGIEGDEKVITPTMLNHYVRQKIVSPPKDKKYNEKQNNYAKQQRHHIGITMEQCFQVVTVIINIVVFDYNVVDLPVGY